MIIHSPVISGSLTFANGATFTLPSGGTYSGSFSGSYQGSTFTGGTFSGTINSTNGVVSGSTQVRTLLPSGVVSGSSQVVGSSITTNTVTIGSTSIALGSTSTTLAGLTIVNSTAFTGSLSGNASTATTLQTARTINGTSFNGSANITIPNLVSGSAQVVSMLSSLNTYTASNDTTNTAQNNRLTSLELTSASLLGETLNLELYTASNDTTNTTQNNRLTSIESATSSYEIRGTGIVSGSSQIQASSITGDITLGTQTSGNYVATLGSGTGVTIGSNTGEGSTPTIAVNYGSTSNTAVQGNTAITFSGTSGEITIDAGSSITLGSGGTVTYGLADTITGNRTFSNDVTITGNLTVNGTTTTVNSNTVNIGDNILILNSDEVGTPSQNGGIEIQRGTSTNASLIWDETLDLWEAGLSGSEVPLVTTTGTQTLTNKTIAAGSNTISGLTNSNLSGTAGITNANLANSSITIAGTATSLGGSITAQTIRVAIGTVVTGSAQVSHDSTTGYSANRHIDHTAVSITAGDGLTGGGDISATRTLNVVGTTNRISVTADAVDIASTYVGQSSITTLGTIGTGTWQGSVIASAYLDADTAHLSDTQTFSGAKTFSAAVNITNNTASTTKTTGALIVTGGVGVSGALNVGGDVVAYASSDKRLKDNIKNIENPIEKVQALNGVTWDWNSNADELQQSLPNIGVIAQEVEKVLPQLVHDRENGFKGVDYAKLTGLLIEAIKEQQKQIDELKLKLG